MSKKVLIERNGSGGVVSTVAIGDGLEFHGEWMSHGYVTVTVNSATEIAFAVGDFVEFAGRKFYLWDEESVKKQARSGSYGEAYVYDNIKLHEGTVALEQVSMHDVVLEDNGQTYSSLSRFSFFGATVDDLADRIQANLVRQSTAIGGDTLRFRLFTPDKTRTTGRMSNMGNVGTAWESYYTGNEATGKKDVAVSIQNETLWVALGHAYNDFELPYYVASSNENDVDYIDIVIGGKAVEVSNSAFVYGKGHGLYEIERSADSDQRIVTKLFAYGSTENLPTNYYGNLYKVAYADCLQSDTLVIDGGNYYFVDAVTGSGILWPSVKDALGVRADVRPSPFSIGGHTPVGKSVTVRCNNTNYTASIWVYETGGEQYLSFKTETQAPVVSDTKFYILDGVDLLKWPNSKIETASGYPGGMAIMNLMLPGFPKQSLADWVDALPAGNATKVRASNYVLSDEETDPWIQSANAAVYGIREGEVYFDGTDDRENIRPSIENTDFGTVASVTGITDDGWVDKTEGFVIKVLAANGGGDFWRAVWDAPHDDEVPLTMTSGYHNGREFKLTKVVVGTTYVELSVDRIQDESGRWVPNTEQPIVGRDLPTPQHDTFVVTGIQLPKEYIDAASEKLLMAAFDELDKIDHGLRTYQPRLDEIYMANEQATAEIESRASLHDTLRAGMVLKWQWEDYGTQGATVISSTIDVLTIKEDGNNGVPTYDVVLRDEKEKSLTEKIATVVSKTTGIGGGTAVRSDGGNADTAKKADRLSGDDEVTAWGQTYWQDGRPKDVSGSLEGVDDITMTGYLNLGNTGMGIDQSGDAVLNSVTIAETTTTTSGGTETTTEDKAVLTEDGLVVTEKVDNTVTKSTVVDENGMTIGTYAEGLFGTGGVFKMINGKAYLEADNLYVRMKAYFDTLEIRRYIHSGGNRVASSAGCKVTRVDQETPNGSFYCYFKANDGDDKITNDFVAGDLAYCHTTNLAGESQNAELNQQDYWRLVMETGSVNADGDVIVRNGVAVSGITDTTATEHYIKLANTTQNVTIDGAGYRGMRKDGDTAPKAGDDVVQLGNVNNSTRRGAIVEAVSGAGSAPTYRIYQGLGADSSNLYTFTSPKVDMGYDMGNAKAYLNVFGNFYVGAEGNNPSTYVRYTQGDGQTQPLLEIKAKIDATSGSSVANVFVGLATNISSYKENDILIVDGLVNPLNYQDENQYYKVVNGDVLIAIRDKGEQSLWKDWRKKDRYTDDTAFNSYVTSLLGEPGNKPSASATDAKKAAYLYNVIKKALGGTTTIDGGLMLTSTIMMRKLNENGNPTVLSDYTTWAGLNGVYDDATENGEYVGAKGHGIAAWFGGEMADWEAYFESLTPVQQASAVISNAYAKSLFRFDGSGYLAGGNISWEDDGDTTVKGTVRADNLYHGVCFFHEEVGEIDHYSAETDPRTDNPYTNNGFISKKHYIDGRKYLSTGTCDVVFMIPYNSTNPWNRNATYEQDQNTYPNFYLDARTLTLPSPADFKGKTIEVFIYTMGDLPDKITTGANAGYGVEKQIKIRSLKIDADGNPVISAQTGRPIQYPVVTAVGFNSITGRPITIQEGENYIVSKDPSVGYLRFQAAMCQNTNGQSTSDEYAWIMSTGMGGVNITNIEGDVIYSQGADKEWVKKWVLAYLGGFGDGDDNWESQMQDDTPDIVGYLPLAGGVSMDNANLITNLNADLLDGHHASDFVTSAKFGSSGAVLYPSNGLLTLPEFMATSERGNYVKIDGDIMMGNLQMSAGTAIKANDANADLLAYKSSNGEGVTGAHWFVGTGHQGVVRSSGALERYNGSTAYTIWDESNFTPSNYLLSSAISDWAKAANKPAYNLDEVTDGSTRKLSDYATTSALSALNNAAVKLSGNNTMTGQNVFQGITTFQSDVFVSPNNTLFLQSYDSASRPIDSPAASQAWVGQQGYLTSADISGYATTSELTSGLAGKQNLIHFLNTKNNNTEVAFSYLHLPLGSIGGGHASLDLSDYATTSAVGTVMTGIDFLASGQVAVYTKNVGSGQSVGDLVNTPYALAAQLGGYVTLATEQTISGAKTINNVLTVNGSNSATFALEVAGAIRANTGIRIGASQNDALMMDTSSVVYSKAVQSGGVTTAITSTLATFGWDNTDQSAQYGYLDFSHRPKVGGVNVALTSDLSGYLPLTAGSGKALTGSLYVTPGAGVHQTVEIDGSLYKIGLAIGSGNTNRGLYGQTIGGSDNWLLYFDASNTILNYGNVGIGTASPAYKIDVNGHGRINYLLFKDYNDSNNAGYCGRGGSSNNNIQLCGYSGNSVSIGANGSDNDIFINTSHNVGIGTTQPDRKLHVNGDFGVGNVYAGSYLFMNANNAGIYMNSTGIAWHNSSNQWTADLITFTSSGNVGIGTSPSTKLHVVGNTTIDGDVYLPKDANGYREVYIDGLDSLSYEERVVDNVTSHSLYVGYDYVGDNDTTNIFGRTIEFYTTSRSEKMRIDSSGNVGIGITSPAYKLDVSGVINASDGVMARNANGNRVGIGPTSLMMGVGTGTSAHTATVMDFEYNGTLNWPAAIAKFSDRPKVATGWDSTNRVNTYTNVALTTDIPSVPAGRSMYFGNCQIFTNSSGTAGTELYLSGNSVHVTSDGVFTFNNEQVVTSSGVAFASKSNNQWTLTANKGAFGSLDVSTYVNMRFSSGSFCFMQTASTKDNNFLFDFDGNVKGYSLNVGVMRISSNQANTDITFASTSGTAIRSYNFDGAIYANGTQVTSDINMKDVKGFVEPSVMDIAHAPIIEFTWKNNSWKELQLGSIAQYWEKILPQAVKTDPKGMLSMNYDAIALASAITAARHSLDNERRIAELELRIAELEDELAAMVSQHSKTTDN